MKSVVWLTFRPLLLVLSMPLLDVLYMATPMSVSLESLLVVFVLALFWAQIGVAGAILCVLAACRRRWRATLSWFAVPALIAAGFYYERYVTPTVFVVGSTVRFIVLLPELRADLAREPRTGEPVLRVWNRGGMIWHSSGIVYDESDEVALPPGRQSAAWQKRAQQSELACEGFHVVPLFDHFYIADFPC